MKAIETQITTRTEQITIQLILQIHTVVEIHHAIVTQLKTLHHKTDSALILELYTVLKEQLFLHS